MDEVTENGEVETLILAAATADSGRYESEPEEGENTDEKETSISYHVNTDEDTEKAGNKQKRKREDEADTLKRYKTADGYAEVVATHYNQLKEKGLNERSKSRIVYLRNFHNWIKSMLINEYLTKIKERKKHNAPLRVHDMCCGKGGDLLKWRKGGITHLICSDIASVSLEQCKARYNDMKSRASRDRASSNIYSIEYILGDCTKTRLREKFSDPSMKLDLVSCQFAFHYSFESLPQAECMLRNASECLQPGGYFIGTIPDAYDLVARAKKYESNTYGNNVYQVTLDFDLNKPDLFGAKCDFHLHGVVDCPEFLVHFPVFVKLAKKYGLKLINKEKFYDFFERMKAEGKQLLNNMAGLETYPPNSSATLFGTEEDDYTHANEFIKKEGRDNLRIGTLSKSEWEASCKLISHL